MIPLASTVIEQAAEVGEPMLRSLDAVHLASALSIRDDLTAFVAYDHRLFEAAQQAGLPAQRPGVAS